MENFAIADNFQFTKLSAIAGVYLYLRSIHKCNLTGAYLERMPRVPGTHKIYRYSQIGRLRRPLFARFERRASRPGGALALLTFLTRNEEVDWTQTWEIFVQTFLKYSYRLYIRTDFLFIQTDV